MYSKSALPKGDFQPKYSEEIAETICESIRTGGVSDACAARLAHVSAETIRLWKQRQPGFADRLQKARAQFHFARLEEIRTTITTP